MGDQQAAGKLSVLGQGNQLLPGGIHAARVWGEMQNYYSVLWVVVSGDSREPADLASCPVRASLRAGLSSPADRSSGGGQGMRVRHVSRRK
eukprot:5397247-Pyramimonas_sp.AAC.1